MRSHPLLAALLSLATVLPAAARVLPVPSGPYPTIQAAVNAARTGDTVRVNAKPGKSPYREAVTISTPGITLQGVGSPVLDGAGLGTAPMAAGPDGIAVQADGVTVSGFVVQNFNYTDPDGWPRAGITVGAANGVSITGNVTRGNYWGLYITAGSSGDLVQGNQATQNADAGVVVFASQTVVAGNQSLQNAGEGLALAYGTGLQVYGNELAGDQDGLYAASGAPTVIAGNSCHDNVFGGIISDWPQQTISANMITHNGAVGIDLNYSDGAAVTGNVVTGTQDPDGSSGQGIFGGSGDSCTIANNQVNGNAGDGILLYVITRSAVNGNLASGNGGAGIHASYSTNPFFAPDPTTGYQNDLTRNTAKGDAWPDAMDDAAVAFHATSNIWSANTFGRANPATFIH